MKGGMYDEVGSEVVCCTFDDSGGRVKSPREEGERIQEAESTTSTINRIAACYTPQ
jgi:hypothetical protein